MDKGADFYLDRLREVYERLADPASGRLTRASWEAACRTSKSDDSPSPAWGSATLEADERDVAQVLFDAADLADDDVLSFMGSPSWRTSDAAGAGDREAQADILFMLIDKDQNQTIETRARAVLPQRGEVGHPRRGPAARLREVWSDAAATGTA